MSTPKSEFPGIPQGGLSGSKWFVVQLGARENYAVAQALHSQGNLESLMTDNWHPDPPLISNMLGQSYVRKIAGRHCPALSAAKVTAFNTSSLRFELTGKLRRKTGWDLIRRRNAWFQNQVVRWLEDRLTPEHTIFTYSYASKKILELAKRVGCQTVLGQIDPGIGEEDIVAAEVARFPNIDTGFARAPQPYWDDWRSECDLADQIMVNSEWSKGLVVNAGVDVSKVKVIPLVGSPDSDSQIEFQREYPAEFTLARPLNVLYLGQVIPRKGIHYVIEAARILASSPVIFTVVGDPGPWRELMLSVPNIDVVGNVPRSDVNRYYQAADLFLFPTLSDGYGLTQLEAQSWRLPLICSTHCGAVVENHVNGIELEDISTASVVAAIQRVLSDPAALQRWSENAKPAAEFGLPDLANRLIQLSNGG